MKSVHDCLSKVWLCTVAGFAFLLLCSRMVYADASSTNFALEGEYQSSGALLSAASTNYALEESALDFNAKDNLSSTNYALEGSVGYGQSLVPIISSVSPGDFSKYFTDESPSFTVTATDPDSDSLEYQLKMDGTVKDAFQASNVLTFALSSSDRGRRSFAFEVRDSSDGTVSQNQSSYIFRRPIR